VNVGAVVSIRVTIAVVSQVFPALSSKVKVNDPFVVKRYIHDHPLLVIVTGSLNPVSTAMTFPLVRAHDAGVYSIVAVGGIVSCI